MGLASDVKPDSRGVVVILPADLHRQLKFVALEEDTTLQQLMKSLVVEYLEKRETELAVK